MKGRYKRSRLVVMCVIATMLVAVAVICAVRPREPEYQGKTASVWFRQLNFPPRQGDPAARALVEMGSEVVPYMARRVGGPKTFFDKTRDWIWFRLPPALRAKFPAPDDWRVHGKAAWILSKMGPDARTAVPALRTALNNRQQIVRCFAVEALGRIGEKSRETVGALSATLRGDPDSTVRSQAAEALGRLGAAARSALPSLVELLKANDPWTRNVAAEAIMAIDREKAADVFQALHERGISLDEFLNLQTRAQMEPWRGMPSMP